MGEKTMEKRPFFSIIIPVYNVAPYLRECLDSVLAQTFKDWEAICVDDGSTDESGKILDEYGARDKRFRVVHQVNAGVSAARNRGLEEAKGEWVWFVDADDAVKGDALAELWCEIRKYADLHAIKIDFLQGCSVPKEWPQGEAMPCEIFQTAGNGGVSHFFAAMWGMIFRRKSIGTLRFEDFPRGEDSIFIAAFARYCFPYLIFPRKLYFYRQRSDSAIHITPTREIVEVNFRSQKRLVDVFAETVVLLGNPPAEGGWAKLFVVSYDTYNGMYFKLPIKDRQCLLEQWLALLDSFKGRYVPSLGLRIRIFLIRSLRLGCCIKLIALWQPLWLRCIRWSVRLFKRVKALCA